VTLAFSTVMLAAAPARSQHAPFLDGAAAGALVSGTFAGGGGIGVPLSPRYDVRFEVEMTEWTFDRVHMRNSLGRFDLVDGSRPISYTVLVGRRFRPRRYAQFAVLGGYGVVRSSWQESYHDELKVNGAVISRLGWDLHGTSRGTQLTVGVEAAIVVTTHLAIVPRWRGQMTSVAEGSSAGFYLPTSTVRNLAGGGLRWRF
jgi:hypothetical protein